MSEQKTKGQQLAENLFSKKSSAFDGLTEEKRAQVHDFAEAYKSFIDIGKTEREAADEAIRLAEEAGFRPYTLGMELKAGDRMYYNNRGKNVFFFVVGTDAIENGVRIVAAHIDAPRLDLKQKPLTEESGFAFFKTHYYGGIRKYQWITIPLALHGVLKKKDGEIVRISVGEDEGDPVFCITDLLPHLAQDQSAKPLGTAFTGEGLQILIGSEPFDDEAVSDRVKLTVMQILNKKYGITEDDFLSAEISAVPAGKARDVGFDRALVGAYAHDDRVCSFPAMRAVLEAKAPKNTVMCVLADKEEIGSMGNSGLQSSLLRDLIEEISRALGGDPIVVRANSLCLSADVAAGFDPLYPEVFDRKNTATVSGGVVMNKYTGARGKSGTNDASAEYIGTLRALFEKEGIIWQTAEIGKVDQGGGGTVAQFIANANIETVDLGVPVMSMHAPFELISKYDLYEAYRAFCAFVLA